jgi:hypothetical protein
MCGSPGVEAENCHKTTIWCLDRRAAWPPFSNSKRFLIFIRHQTKLIRSASDDMRRSRTWRNDFEAKQWNWWNWWRTVARIRYRDPRKINSFLVHGLSRGFRWYGDDRADNELRVAIGSGAVKAFDASGNKISQLARLARDPEIYFEAVAIRTSWPSAHVIDDLNVAQHPKRNYLKQRNRGPNLKKRAAALKALKSKLQSGKITEDDLQGAKPWKTIAGELGVGRTLARQLAEQVLAQKIPRAASRGSRRGADK